MKLNPIDKLKILQKAAIYQCNALGEDDTYPAGYVGGFLEAVNLCIEILEGEKKCQTENN